MNMKKLLSFALALVMALGMASFGMAEEPIKVGVCIYQFNDNFMTLYRTELQKYLEETYGAQVTVVDGKNDQTEQTNQIKLLHRRGRGCPDYQPRAVHLRRDRHRPGAGRRYPHRVHQP